MQSFRFRYQARPLFKLKILFFVFSLMSPPSSFSQPETLNALFPSGAKVKKGSKKSPQKLLPLPNDYAIFIHVKEVLEHGKDLAAIEKAQQKILLEKAVSESKALDREADDLFYALEIKRGEKLSSKKAWQSAVAAFGRGLNGLSSLKWVYYWSEAASDGLAHACQRSKKKQDEFCLALAKKIADVFPKTALETKVLRDLPLPESPVASEVNGDRLSQSYTEKTEKDEQAFDEVLDAFLKRDDSDLIKKANSFTDEFPKSILRFRASFLIAETYFRKNQLKEAAPYYQTLIDQVPLSFYAIVASERLAVSLTDRVKKEPIQVDSELFNFNVFEKASLARIQALQQKKQDEGVGLEFESLSRVRTYSNDLLLYLMSLAHRSNQSLASFRFATELIQRKYNGFYQQEMMEMIFPDRFQKEIANEAELNQLDPLLVTSLIKQESGFRASIISASGALGLMQLMPFTALEVKKDLYLATLKTPSKNIAIGEKYLADLMGKWESNPVYALASYNAGPHRVTKWKKDAKPEWGMIEFIEAIPFKETREYVMSILRNRYWYEYRRGVPTKSVFDGWKK